MSINNQNQYIRSALMNPSNLIDMNNCLNLESSMSSYDDIKFFNVDHFNMESFKSDCILNMDQAIILDNKTIGESSVLLEEPSEELEDIRSTFAIDDSMKKSMPLLDLEKPIINIDIGTLTTANEQHQQSQNHHLNYQQQEK